MEGPEVDQIVWKLSGRPAISAITQEKRGKYRRRL